MIAVLSILAPPVSSAVASNAAAMGSPTELLRVVLSLVAVVVMILAVGWLTRRLQARVKSGGQRVRCIESLSVGLKERVLLLQVGERQLLVGASQTGLRTLLVLDEPVPAPPPAAHDFPRSFRDALAQWKKPR